MVKPGATPWVFEYGVRLQLARKGRNRSQDSLFRVFG